LTGIQRAAAVTLSLGAATLAAELRPHSGALLAVFFALAVAAFWWAGTPRRLGDRLLGGGLALSLLAGSLFATGVLGPSHPAAGLLGLVLLVTALPLLLTSAGFALGFESPDPDLLRRLRENRE